MSRREEIDNCKEKSTIRDKRLSKRNNKKLKPLNRLKKR
jgi:hypothetical protein